MLTRRVALLLAATTIGLEVPAHAQSSAGSFSACEIPFIKNGLSLQYSEFSRDNLRTAVTDILCSTSNTREVRSHDIGITALVKNVPINAKYDQNKDISNQEQECRSHFESLDADSLKMISEQLVDNRRAYDSFDNCIKELSHAANELHGLRAVPSVDVAKLEPNERFLWVVFWSPTTASAKPPTVTNFKTAGSVQCPAPSLSKGDKVDSKPSGYQLSCQRTSADDGSISLETRDDNISLSIPKFEMPTTVHCESKISSSKVITIPGLLYTGTTSSSGFDLYCDNPGEKRVLASVEGSFKLDPKGTDPNLRTFLKLCVNDTATNSPNCSNGQEFSNTSSSFDVNQSVLWQPSGGAVTHAFLVVGFSSTRNSSHEEVPADVVLQPDSTMKFEQIGQ